MTATFDSTTAPATLTVTPTARWLTPGTYTATISLMSTASGVSDSPIVVPVQFVVVTIPTTGISVSPTPIRVTVRAGGSFRTTFSVHANGDTQVGQMAFAPPTQYLPLLGYSLACTPPFEVFTTPCSGIVEMVYGTPPPGTYTAIVPIKSYATGSTALLILNLTVTP